MGLILSAWASEDERGVRRPMKRMPQLSPGLACEKAAPSPISNPRAAPVGTRSGGALVHQLVVDGNLKRDR